MINTNSWNKIRYTLYQPFYDVIARYFRPLRSKSIHSVKLIPSDKVLIIGAGTGLDLEFLNPKNEITAIDITPVMLQKLKQRSDALKLNTTVHVMDGSKLDFENESFDVVILHLILAVIPDPIGCIKETERVLKPGGRFTIMDKFVSPGKKISFTRRIVNPFTTFLATTVNRDVDILIDETSLLKTRHEPLASIFWLIQGEKSVKSSDKWF